MPPAPRAARGFFPLDETLALGASRFSPRLVEGIARLGTEMPFGRAVETLAFFTGVEMGVETARGLVEGAGAALVELEAAEIEELERTGATPPLGAPMQQVSVDGAMVPLLRGEWAEVKTLAVGAIRQERMGEGEWKVHTGELSYFSRLTDAFTFGQLTSGELHRRGTDRASVVCAVNDGAEWIANFIAWHCPKAVRILDFPHAAEHLAAAAHAVFGAGSADAAEWLGVQFHDLRHKDPDQVLKASCGHSRSRGSAFRLKPRRCAIGCSPIWRSVEHRSRTPTSPLLGTRSGAGASRARTSSSWKRGSNAAGCTGSARR